MKRIVISILVVFLILLGTSHFTLNTAHENWNEEHLWLLETLLPGTTECVRVPYTGEDPIIRDVHKGEKGYVIQTVTQGYVGEITMSIGVNNEGRVTGLVVEEAYETLGLGSRILTDHAFLAQFLNQTGSFEVSSESVDAFSGATAAAEPEGEVIQVDAISGATVSSKAVARCVNSAVAYVTGVDAVSAATTWGG